MGLFMIFNEEEKRIIEETNDYYKLDPFNAVDEGLVQSHFDIKEQKEFIETIYRCAKRLLTEVAKNRGLTVNEKDYFKPDEVIRDISELQDLNPYVYENYETFKKYIDSKVLFIE